METTQKALHLLVHYLKRVRECGRDRVLLEQPAKDALNAMNRARRRKRKREAAGLASSDVPAQDTLQQEAAPDQSQPVAVRPKMSLVEQFSQVVEGGRGASGLTGPAPEAPSAQTRMRIELPQTNKVEQIRFLQKQLAADPVVQGLPNLLRTMVFSTGNLDAELMLIGEAPGSEEEVKREPFVGPAGQLLTKILVTMGLPRESVYISNIVKYRPAMPNQGTQNRKPTPDEMAACLPYIFAEIEVVRPKIIVGLGGTAAEGLTGTQKPVGQFRGRVYQWNQVPFMITYHPSYLLRRPDLSEKRKVWEDMLLVMEELQMPISEKQRSFFTKA